MKNKLFTKMSLYLENNSDSVISSGNDEIFIDPSDLYDYDDIVEKINELVKEYPDKLKPLFSNKKTFLQQIVRICPELAPFFKNIQSPSPKTVLGNDFPDSSGNWSVKTQNASTSRKTVL